MRVERYGQGDIRVTHEQNQVLPHVKLDDVPAVISTRRVRLSLDIAGAAPPQVELGAYQVQIGTPASLSADFTVHS